MSVSVILVFFFHFVYLMWLLHGQLYNMGRESNTSGRHDMKSPSQTDVAGAQGSQRAARISLPENTFTAKFKLITTAIVQILD